MNASEASQPAKSPPPGEVSNFVDPPSIQAAIIAALTVQTAISTLSVMLRCYAQLSVSKKLVWADFWLLTGWAFEVTFAGFLLACLPYGGGNHLWDVTKGDFAHVQFLLFVNYILYGCAIVGPKISILLQLMAVFVPRGRSLSASSRWFYWASVFLIAANLIYYLAHNFALIFQCTPIPKGWNSKIPGSCINQYALLESSAPFNIISDFLMFLLPLTTIWQLQLPTKTRFGIASAFGIGLFGCICSAVRLTYNERLSSSGDVTYLTFQNQLWANAEVTAAILISSVIILPRFIRLKREGSKSYEYSDKNSGGRLRASGPRVLKGKPPSDPYSELTETKSRNDTTFDNDGHGLGGPYVAGRSAASGIVQTIQIDRVEERMYPPAHVAANHPSKNVETQITGNTTRWYDDDHV